MSLFEQGVHWCLLGSVLFSVHSDFYFCNGRFKALWVPLFLNITIPKSLTELIFLATGYVNRMLYMYIYGHQLTPAPFLDKR
ncbi:hypothetical protein BJP44_06930 [Candidatus Williamhamiltonella defendens]|nr:hypothetical protein BJP44_06930 [Candidatus Hamiltonella defensa]